MVFAKGSLNLNILLFLRSIFLLINVIDHFLNFLVFGHEYFFDSSRVILFFPITMRFWSFFIFDESVVQNFNSMLSFVGISVFFNMDRGFCHLHNIKIHWFLVGCNPLLFQNSPCCCVQPSYLIKYV